MMTFFPRQTEERETDAAVDRHVKGKSRKDGCDGVGLYEEEEEDEEEAEEEEEEEGVRGIAGTVFMMLKQDGMGTKGYERVSETTCPARECNQTKRSVVREKRTLDLVAGL